MIVRVTIRVIIRSLIIMISCCLVRRMIQRLVIQVLILTHLWIYQQVVGITIIETTQTTGIQQELIVGQCGVALSTVQYIGQELITILNLFDPIGQ